MGDNQEDSRLEMSQQNKQIIQQVFELELDGHKDARELYKEEIAGFLIKTDDGSYTLSSEKRSDGIETLHSTFGARTEALKNLQFHLNLKKKQNQEKLYGF